MTPLDEPDALNISALGRGEDKFFSKKILQSAHALSRRISFGYAAVVPAELAFFFSAASGEGNEFAAPALLRYPRLGRPALVFLNALIDPLGVVGGGEHKGRRGRCGDPEILHLHE